MIMSKYTDMYPYQDKATGYWFVVRVIDGHKDCTPFSWETKESAIRYCKNHGFDCK